MILLTQKYCSGICLWNFVIQSGILDYFSFYPDHSDYIIHNYFKEYSGKTIVIPLKFNMSHSGCLKCWELQEYCGFSLSLDKETIFSGKYEMKVVSRCDPIHQYST